MTLFQQTAVLASFVWMMLVIVRFRRSRIILTGGLLVIGLYTFAAVIFKLVKPDELGLSTDVSWLGTIVFALAGLVIAIICSPLADRLASRWFRKPPTLEAFSSIQESRGKLVAGIIIAWALGGILEELTARGIVLNSIESWLSTNLNEPIAATISICVAAIGDGAMHSYQGPRAMAVITQISVIFGVVFVASGNHLWSVMICHGLYDTIAFIRFATKKSRHSKPDYNIHAVIS